MFLSAKKVTTKSRFAEKQHVNGNIRNFVHSFVVPSSNLSGKAGKGLYPVRQLISGKLHKQPFVFQARSQNKRRWLHSLVMCHSPA